MSTTSSPRNSELFGNTFLSLLIGSLAFRFGNATEPLVKLACVVGGIIAALLAVNVLFQLLGFLVSATAKGTGLLLRYYGYRKAMAGIVAAGVLVPGILVLSGLRWTAEAPWIYVLPPLASIAIYFLPDGLDRLRGIPFVMRQFLSGGRPREDFAGAYSLRGFSWPLRRMRHPQAGYLAAARYIGRSLPESTLTPRDVWIADSVSEVTYAATGGGKSFDIKINGCLWAGDMFIASTKPDLSDDLLGRRSDPATWFGSERRDGYSGIDVRGISQVTRHIPCARSALLDPHGHSIYTKQGRYSGHTILSDIDIRDPHAASLIYALATASVPQNDRTPDPFWQNTTRAAVAAMIGFVKVTKSPDVQTLPHVVDLLLGIDEQGRADPDRFRRTLIEMRKVNALNGIIAAGASALDELGDKAYGAISAEIRNSLRWIMLLRDHLSAPSTFSYRDMGQAGSPMSVFLIQPSLAPAEAAPYMRTHISLMLSILKAKPRPRIPTLFVGDEYRQYGKGIDEIASGSMILRSYGIKLNLYLQNYAALVSTVGEQAAHEICSSSTERYYAVNDIDTAERLSKRLGEREETFGRYRLVSPQDILRELDPRSALQYCLPYAGGGPMKLERLAHMPIRTAEGLRLRGLPLQGLFDDFSS